MAIYSANVATFRAEFSSKPPFNKIWRFYRKLATLIRGRAPSYELKGVIPAAPLRQEFAAPLTYLYFRMSCTGHWTPCFPGLTWKSSYALLPEERGVDPRTRDTTREQMKITHSLNNGPWFWNLGSGRCLTRWVTLQRRLREFFSRASRSAPAREWYYGGLDENAYPKIPSLSSIV